MSGPMIPLPRAEPGAASVPQRPSVEAAREFAERLSLRRSVRHFSPEPVDREVIRWVVTAAAGAPSGANKQPWTFVAVDDPALKRRIREGAEAEERRFYEGRANAEWLADLDPLGTGPEKPFLEEAPWLIVVFKRMKDRRPERASDQVYYVNESVGIATGFLIAAIHAAGQVTVTRKPGPLAGRRPIIRRPEFERPFLLLPVGRPAEGCMVPRLERRPLQEVLVWNAAPGARA